MVRSCIDGAAAGSPGAMHDSFAWSQDPMCDALRGADSELANKLTERRASK